MTETRAIRVGPTTTMSVQGQDAAWPDATEQGRSPRRGRVAAGHERTAVLICVAVVAAHVLDDNFVQPEPGTVAGEHLISGLIPVLLLAAVATVHPRMRPGLRAVNAMTLGALGVAIGIPAVYYLGNGGLEGDHYSGILASGAGVLLLLTGPIILWSNRRSEGSRAQRYRHRGMSVVCAAVLAPAVLWFLVFPIGVAYVYTHTAPIPGEPDLGVKYEDVVVTTVDGLALTGAYVASRNRAAVVLFPGAGRSEEARMLLQHGYGVLLLDPRGQGGSQGDTVRWAGDRDVLAGVAYLRDRPEVDGDRVGAFGFSVGGEMLLRAAARSEAVAAVISEGAGERIGETDVSGFARFLVDPSQAVMTAATTVFSNHRPPAPIVDRIGDIAPHPVLLIYADPGIGGESTRQPKYFAAAGEPKSIWKVPGSEHTGGFSAEPLEYERRVVAFFDDALSANEDSSERNRK